VTHTHHVHHSVASTITQPTSGSSTASLFVHEIGALLVIVGILWVVARYIKNKSGLGKSLPNHPGKITVLSRQTLAKGVSIAIVHVAGKELLIGVTPSGVSLLSEIDVGASIESEFSETLDEIVGAASVERNPGAVRSTAGRQLDSQWKAGQLGGASPLQAWMAKLDELREMTVRKS
jgi:flagellar biogenesis protein FliO